MSFFETTILYPEDPIHGLVSDFRNDTNPKKVNLGIGVYQDACGHRSVFSSVRQAEMDLLSLALDKNYLPIAGDPEFGQETIKLLFGETNKTSSSENIFCAQTVGGTGALRIGAEFLLKKSTQKIWLPKPSWPNHHQIFSHAHFIVAGYPYYDYENHSLAFEEICQAISKMSAYDVVLMHGCCHNPSGYDPSKEQWKQLSKLIKKQRVIPFFDIAYQGFGKGVDEDAWAIRYFLEQEHEMLIAYSFSKNFGLYGERVGLLAIVCSDEKTCQRVQSETKTLIRGNYSTPPLQGERIVKTILQSQSLCNRWKKELTTMRERIDEMRRAFALHLKQKCPNHYFDPLLNQLGMFGFCGLQPKHVVYLRDRFSLYIPSDGRINIAGLNPKNIEYATDAIASALK